jgi:chitin disaccharide deacetylase
MRHLIVNADDFGACAGVNRGIVEAHRQGIVTSASLMVGMPGSEEAADLAGECPTLSVGLHFSFVDEQKQPVADVADPDACRVVLDEQLARFTVLLGRRPTHLDSHHHVHTRPDLLPQFREVAERCGIPLRECSGARYCSRFYGQWAGERHPEQVSVAGLIRILETEVGDGVTELGCHPGYPDPTLMSSYTEERELELRTLCDARVRRFLETSGIALVAFGEVPGLAASAV